MENLADKIRQYTTHTLLGATIYTIALFQGCHTGYSKGYKQAIEDIKSYESTQVIVLTP
ncbi:MAG: hypothetical protein ACMXYC_05130 [Candidatus Woesearchaeota archaeon]